MLNLRHYYAFFSSDLGPNATNIIIKFLAERRLHGDHVRCAAHLEERAGRCGRSTEAKRQDEPHGLRKDVPDHL